MLISFVLKFNVFWVFILGKSYCIVLGRFVKDFPKWGDCKGQTDVDRNSIRTYSPQPETHLAIARVKLAIARMALNAQLVQDSM